MKRGAHDKAESINTRPHKAVIAGALIWVLFIAILFNALPIHISTSFDRSIIRSSVDESAGEPSIRAEAAELYSLDLGRPIYQKNANKKMDPYSITKVLTCYLVLENADLKKKVEITEDKFRDYVDGSHMMAFKGEIFTVEELLKATMLSSANDAAYFLAVEVAGSEEAFSDMMNKQAAEWGCENTHLINPNGWKDENHYTTAHDMALITAKCFEKAELRELAKTVEYKIDETDMSPEREYENYFWKAVSRNKNILWGKTGSWSEDDCSIVLEFSEDNLNAVIVLLGDTMKKRSEDISKLQEYSHKKTPGFIVASNEKGEQADTVGLVNVKGGAEAVLPICFDSTVVVYPGSESEEDIEVELATAEIEAPIEAGSKVGEYKVIVNGIERAKGDLLAACNVQRGWLLSGFYISNHATILGVIALLAMIILSLLIGIISRKFFL